MLFIKIVSSRYGTIFFGLVLFLVVIERLPERFMCFELFAPEFHGDDQRRKGDSSNCG